MTKKKKKKKSKFKKIKSDLNIPFLILGVILIFIGIIKDGKEIDKNDLKQIKVVLNSNIHNITGTRTDYSYNFWTKNENAEFRIARGIRISENFKDFLNLKENDTLTISIKKIDYDLNDKSQIVPIYSLIHESTSYFNISEFNADSKSYDNRLRIFMLFGGILFLLNGLSILSIRHFFIIAGISIIAVIIMTLFEFGLYNKN